MKRTIITAGLLIGLIGSVSAQTNVEKAVRFRVEKAVPSVEMQAKVHLLEVAVQNANSGMLQSNASAQLQELGKFRWNTNGAQLQELGAFPWGHEGHECQYDPNYRRNSASLLEMGIGVRMYPFEAKATDGEQLNTLGSFGGGSYDAMRRLIY
jgi:hypothetical protein